MGGTDGPEAVVVTGAARGIGRAIAARYAADGARVVVNDLDPAATQAAADEIGGYAVPGDAASAAGVAALVDAAREHLGEVDTYVANAGILQGLGLDAADDDWAHTIEVNVMAHVRAARLLVPGWVERGSGRFVVTASAAGLLTALGSATYSASKHAAVGFAEWLAATYAHRGVRVHAICPQGVTTQMLEDSGELADLLVADGARTPEEVADALMAAVAEDRFLVLPHP
ncbi:MAG TPA: SDR family oxidoreductase, partial [Nocardioides sp.]